MGTYFCWRPSVCAIATALIVLAAAPAHSEIYEFDKRRTEVRFTYEMGPAKQHGRFNQVTAPCNSMSMRRGAAGFQRRLRRRASKPANRSLMTPLKAAISSTSQPIL